MHYILFVDSENLPSTIIPAIKEAFAARGDTYEARVYGCKTAMGYPWKQAIAEARWKFVNVKRTFGDGQALDMAMILDIVDTFHLNRGSGIAVASGDSDFLPALQRIRSHGGNVLVLTDPRETSKKVRDALPDAIVPVNKPHNEARARAKDSSRVKKATPNPVVLQPETKKRTIITVTSARDDAIRKICKQAFNEYVIKHGEAEMPIAKLGTAFQKENHWFKSKTLGFNNMRDLAMSLGIFTVCRKLGASNYSVNEWFLRRKDIDYAKFPDGKPPVEEVVFEAI